MSRIIAPEDLGLTKRTLPKIKARITYPDITKPARLYVLETGFEDAFSGRVERAQTNFAHCFLSSVVDLHGTDYFLGITWGEKTGPMLKLLGFYGMEEWPGEPLNAKMWVFGSGGVAVLNKNCGKTIDRDISRIMVIEDYHRITTSSLKDFIEKPIIIAGLESIDVEAIPRFCC